MIKAAGNLANGEQFIAFGLSDENWVRLRDNRPIMIHLQDDMDPRLPALVVVLLGGPDEESLIEDLRSVGMAR